MPQKRRTSTFDLGNDLTVAMDRLVDRDGITPSEQVRQNPRVLSVVRNRGYIRAAAYDRKRRVQTRP